MLGSVRETAYTLQASLGQRLLGSADPEVDDQCAGDFVGRVSTVKNSLHVSEFYDAYAGPVSGCTGRAVQTL